jgi:ABC-type antimicrobial peptide transport system permease subunit
MIFKLGIADVGGRKLAIMIGGSLTTLGGALLCTAVNVW